MLIAEMVSDGHMTDAGLNGSTDRLQKQNGAEKKTSPSIVDPVSWEAWQTAQRTRELWKDYATPM